MPTAILQRIGKRSDLEACTCDTIESGYVRPDGESEDTVAGWLASAVVAPQINELRFSELFVRLSDEWHDQTDFLSSPTRIAMHPAYQRIIGMGERAIPYILKDLRERGGEWYWALRAIVGFSPVPDAAGGNTRRIKEAWLQWGRQYGYVD